MGAEWFIALGQVLLIDLVLAGDNAIVVGMAAAGLPSDQRRKAILWGIGAATVMRIGFAAITTQLLAIVGLTLMGGLLLLWVCWKMYRELRQPHHQEEAAGAAHEAVADGEPASGAPRKTLRQAIMQILIADVSMSLDNVLAVAGAAKEHLDVLVIGLAISVVLMGVAATFIARMLERFRWIAWVGLAVIVYVAIGMILDGTQEVTQQVPDAYAYLLLPLGYLALPHAFPAWLWVAATLAQIVIIAVVMAFVGELIRGAMRPARREPLPKHDGLH